MLCTRAIVTVHHEVYVYTFECLCVYIYVYVKVDIYIFFLFQVNIRAIDNRGSKSKFSDVVLSLNIILDKAPFFRPSSYLVDRVNESEPVGSTIATVTAEDVDLEVTSFTVFLSHSVCYTDVMAGDLLCRLCNEVHWINNCCHLLLYCIFHVLSHSSTCTVFMFNVRGCYSFVHILCNITEIFLRSLHLGLHIVLSENIQDRRSLILTEMVG